MSNKSRRQWLLDAGFGFGWLAASALANAQTHFEPKAKRILQIFTLGGMSHMDTFDYKPELDKRDGKPFDMPTFFGQAGNLYKSPWKFERRGQSGIYVSDLLPHLATQADKLTVIRSMVAKSANHMPAVAQMNTGFILSGFPAMGAWVTYALGTENQNLPAFVVLPDHRNYPWGGTLQWSNGFLPAAVQGTAFKSAGDPVPDLTSPFDQSKARQFAATLNRSYAEQRPGDTDLDARVRAYELAAQMQLSVPDAVSLEAESDATKMAYGFDQPETGHMARRCVLARRLIERGVRFVQVYHGASGTDWDAHGDLLGNHGKMAREYDQPVAALLSDLAARGLLKDTLVMGVTEFGRTPVAQGAGKKGRDHHPNCFTCWLAGAGVTPGIAYGASDELGYQPAENPVTVYDFHATALHLLGLNHEKLTYYHNGVRRRLTDVHGHVVKSILS
ncbi:MAG: DUF1501 domain-containing protein [Bryobacterales bacterium]|nr:DUF1501 domain-containing protein [Bryobacterales bacterium]